MSAIYCWVIISPFQDQFTKIQEFQKSVESFSPQLDSLSSVAAQADHSSQQDTSACSKATDVQHRYDKLNVLATERLSMLNAYLPDVQQYESSKSAWNALLCGWEAKNSAMPPLGATPQLLQPQIDEIKVSVACICTHSTSINLCMRSIIV